jgi:hypothetical protein
VIVDPSRIESMAWAVAALRDGARVVNCREDVALLWYDVLAEESVAIRGALRPSDVFVLRRLAHSAGRDVERVAACESVVAFRIGAPAALVSSRR